MSVMTADVVYAVCCKYVCFVSVVSACACVVSARACVVSILVL